MGPDSSIQNGLLKLELEIVLKSSVVEKILNMDKSE